MFRLFVCACVCRESAEDEFGFSCKFDECAESKEAPNLDCVYQFTIDSCCMTKKICDKAEIDKLPRCWSDGHEFVKGNLIYSPSAPCYKCLCDEKFNNQTEAAQNPNCKAVECGIELHQLSYLQLGCIPVYFDDGLCCPFEFRCRAYSFPFSIYLLFFFSIKFFRVEHQISIFQFNLNIVVFSSLFLHPSHTRK